jgi:hypothetical protein
MGKEAGAPQLEPVKMTLHSLRPTPRVRIRTMPPAFDKLRSCIDKPLFSDYRRGVDGMALHDTDFTKASGDHFLWR